MKVAISSQGAGPDSALDQRFGRASHFIVFTLPDGGYESVENASRMDLSQGAGIQAAERVAGLSVDALVSGHCGPKAFKALSLAGIKVYCAGDCKVSEALEDFKAGRFKALEKPDVEGHW